MKTISGIVFTTAFVVAYSFYRLITLPYFVVRDFVLTIAIEDEE